MWCYNLISESLHFSYTRLTPNIYLPSQSPSWSKLLTNFLSVIITHKPKNKLSILSSHPSLFAFFFPMIRASPPTARNWQVIFNILSILFIKSPIYACIICITNVCILASLLLFIQDIILDFPRPTWPSPVVCPYYSKLHHRSPNWCCQKLRNGPWFFHSSQLSHTTCHLFLKIHLLIITNQQDILSASTITLGPGCQGFSPNFWNLK